MRFLVGFFLLVGTLAAFAQNEVARPDIPGELMVDIGLNYLDSEPLFVDQTAFTSKSIGLYYMKRKAVSNKFSLYYGAGLGFEKLSMGDSVTLSSGILLNTDDANADNDSLAAVALTSLPAADNYSKNRLAITYVDIPLDFRFHPKGTQDGEGLFVGVGGVVGLRMSSHRKLKFDEGGETVIEKTKGQYNLSGIRYGVVARFGFRGVHIFYKKYFSDVFQDPIGGAAPRMTTIGINLTGF